MNLLAAPSQGMTAASEAVLLLMLLSDLVILGIWINYRRRCRLALEQPLLPGDEPDWQDTPAHPAGDVDAAVASAPEERAEPNEPAAPEEPASLSVDDVTPPLEPAIPDFDLSEEATEPLVKAEMPKPPFAPTWSAVHWYLGLQAALLAIAVLVIPMVIPLIVLNPKAAGHPEVVQAYLQQPWMTITMLIVQNIVFIGIPLWAFRRYGASLRSVGLGRPTMRMLLLGALFGVGLLVAAGLVQIPVTHLYRLVLGAARYHALVRDSNSVDVGAMTQTMKSFPMRLAMALVASVAAPIGEELLFRGWLYNCLKRRWNPGVGMVISGLVFGAVHFNPIASPIIVVMGILMAWAYESTGSLYVTMMMHGINNGVSFIGLLTPHAR